MTLHTLSPLDGRYADETAPLREHFSEFAYLRARAHIELDYLSALSEIDMVRPLSDSEKNLFREIITDFSDADAKAIQAYERETRHDVKAIEYFLRDKLPGAFNPWLHFGLTSEDVNNIAIALALKDSRDSVILPALNALLNALAAFAKTNRATPMLARTHGQPAVPTTLGKEIAVFLARLKTYRDEIGEHRFEAKLTGAIGNFNALNAAAPNVDWLRFSESFISKLGLQPNLVTIQILPYDNWIRYFDILRRTNAILTDLAQDMWRYISDGLLSQTVVEGEVGSSTMPQKVNPIHFENAEGNLGLANAMFAHFAQKLPISRLQRDLSDSTVRRTFGTALGHTLLAWNNLTRGMGRVQANKDALHTELNAHWEVVSEGAQTILRAAGRGDAYETLKEATRGRVLTEAGYKSWVDALDVDEKTRENLRGLSPESYLGLAVQITDKVLEDFTEKMEAK
jgi:adenylosuccinate lyase